MSEAGDKVAEGIERFQRAQQSAEQTSAELAVRRAQESGAPAPSSPSSQDENPDGAA